MNADADSSPGALAKVEAADLLHIKRLIGSWGMVADFCFGDLLLFVPEGGQGVGRTDPSSFVVAGQVRPTTSQTLYQIDLVGRVVSVAERPLLADTWTNVESNNGQNYSLAESIGRAGRVHPGVSSTRRRKPARRCRHDPRV